MKQQIDTLGRLAGLRTARAQQVLGQVACQQQLCQRYRRNIDGLTRLCGISAAVSTSLQRANQQQYKATLHRMLELQRRELQVAEEGLRRVQDELRQALCSQKALTQLLDDKLDEWRTELARQEQRIQDGLAAQAWWRTRGA